MQWLLIQDYSKDLHLRMFPMKIIISIQISLFLLLIFQLIGMLDALNLIITMRLAINKNMGFGVLLILNLFYIENFFF